MAEAQEGTEPEAGQGAASESASSKTAGARLAARRAAKAAKKAAKRGTETQPEEEVAEELEQTVAQATSWLDENKTRLLGALAVIMVAGGALVALTSHNRQVSGDAASQLQEGVDALLARVGTDEGEADDGTTTYATEEARAAEALAAFRKSATEFSDSPAAAWARLGEANALRAQGKPDEALAVYGDVQTGDDGALKHFAAMGAAFALEDQGKHEAAKAKFEEAATADGDRYTPPGQYHAARMLVALGQRDKAVETLKQLVELTGSGVSDGPQYAALKGQAETMLAELGEAPAPSAGGAPDSAALQKLLQQLNLDKGVAK